jgi:hypothetical protein
MRIVNPVRRREPKTDTSATGLNERGTSRHLPIASGIAFVAILFPAFGLVPEPPGTDAPVEQIASYYGRHVDGQLTATFMWGLALTALLLFIGSFYSVLRTAEGGTGTLSLMALLSGTVAVTIMIVAQAATGATAIIASEGISPEVVRGMDETAHIVAHLFAIPLGAFLASASTAALKYRVTGRWLGVLGVMAGLANAVGTAGIFEPRSALHNLGVLGLLGFVIWTLGTSFSLLRLRFQAPIQPTAQQSAVV